MIPITKTFQYFKNLRIPQYAEFFFLLLMEDDAFGIGLGPQQAGASIEYHAKALYSWPKDRCIVETSWMASTLSFGAVPAL